MAFGWSLGETRAGPGTAGPHVELHRGWEVLDRLEADWAHLFDEQIHPAPCVSHAAFRALRTVSSGGLQPLFVTLVTGGSVAAILPLEERRFPAARVLRPLGFGRLARHEPLVGHAARHVNAGQLLKAAALKAGPRTLFDLRGLRAGGAGARWIEEGVAGKGAWRTLPGELESTVGLRGGWPRVEASLALSQRRLASEGRRRAERSGGIWVEGLRPRRGGDVAPLLELAQRNPHGYVDAALMEAFATEASVRGRLRLLELRQRRRLVAGSLVWIAGRQAVELLTCTDERLEGLHLAAQVRYELFRHLAESEVVDSVLLAPGARVEAGLPPARQVRLIGAPGSGLGHLVAGGVARLADDRVEPGRSMARWRARRRLAESTQVPGDGGPADADTPAGSQLVEAETH